jgi:hypothetical protein
MDVEHSANAAVERIAGGYAVYCGANSPVTQAAALGLHGPVARAEFDRLEEFNFTRSEPARLETCPMADASLFEIYGERGYRVTEFSNVMARPVGMDSAWMPPEDVKIRRVTREEVDAWTLTVAQSFAEHFRVTHELLSVMKMFALGRDMECYLARIDGRIFAGTAPYVKIATAPCFSRVLAGEAGVRSVQPGSSSG